MTTRRDRFLAFFGLLCLALMMMLGKSWENTLPTNDASVHADLALSATAHGLIPILPIGAESTGGHWGAGFNDHPFFGLYVEGWILRLFGPTAWSAKLLPCLLTVGSVMLTAWLGALWSNPLTGLFSGLILLTSRHFTGNGIENHLDCLMAFFILASFVAWEKGRPWLASVLAGVGMWFKSPLALLLFPAQALAVLIRRRPRRIWPVLFAGGALALVVGLCVWIPIALQGGGRLLYDYWVRQVWGLLILGKNTAAAHDPLIAGRQNPGAHDPLLVWHTIVSWKPWSYFLAISLASALWRQTFRYRSTLVPFAAAAVMVVVVSVMRSQHSHYLDPIYPFLALLAARPLGEAFQELELPVLRGFAVVPLLLGTFFLVTPTIMGPETFPALRKFSAFIQSSGQCTDRVLVVTGGEPYGGFYDERALLNFYSGRNVLSASCAEAGAQPIAPEVHWVISRDNCPSDPWRSRFPAALRVGSAVLRTDRIETSPVVDLTSLARELRAPTDCVAAPLPHNRYF
ncbi:MAG: ArnT family glycosyltransferase [Bdellovibrionota bacterium]